MNQKQLEEIKGRIEKATPGPWKAKKNCAGSFVVHGEGTDESYFAWLCSRGETSADFDFIAHARQDMPALIAEVEQLQTAQLKAFNAGYDVQQKHIDETVRQYGAEIDRLTGERDEARQDCANAERLNMEIADENAALRKALMQAIRDGHTSLSPASHQKLFDYYIQREEDKEKSKL